MKKHIIVICSTFICIFAQNLLENPGFEFWTGGMPSSWEKDGGVYIYQENGIKHGGNFSVRESLITQNQSDADFYQMVPVQPNTYYRFSVWVWDNDPAGRIGIGINWLPSGAEWSSVYSVDALHWQELLFNTEPSPTHAESALVMIRAYDSSATWDGEAIVYVDDAYFAPLPTQPPVIVRVWHTPVNPGSSVDVDVYAKVSDDGIITADTLCYGVNDLNDPMTLSHTSIENDTFKFQIPGQTAHDTVFYYLKFFDDDGLETASDTYAYYVGKLNVVLNEILYDTQGSDEGCFIELFGPGGTNLDGFSIVGVNGNNGNDYVTIDLSGYSSPGDGFFVVAQDITVPNYDMVTSDANLQNSPDNVALRFNTITIDALGYGEIDGWVFTGEWFPAPDVADDHSLGRCPDGFDSDNNYSDFNDYAEPTPGQPNPMAVVQNTKLLNKEIFFIANPVRRGTTISSLINSDKFFPILVYNALGRVIQYIRNPNSTLALPCGIYFLKLNNCPDNCAKIVVVR